MVSNAVLVFPSIGASGGLPLAQGIAQTAPALVPAPWQSVLYAVLLVIMAVGVVGAVVPAMPGISLVLGAVILWGLVVGFSSLKWALGVAIVATVLSLFIDYLAGVLGAQRVGASAWGQIGAVIGMGLGLFGLLPLLPTGIPLLGLLLGTIIGAFLGEFLYRHDLQLGDRLSQSGKVGVAIVVGTLVGNLLQGVLALIALVVFVVTTWPGAWAML
ncbi:MAG: DUF456 family protein [Leptolyngbya sp.]|nr:DUF456 family protein [Leptolyngbya sp.]